MMQEIQKAIDYIHAYMHPVDDSESEKRKLKYRDMAIRSLEAWEKVKAEIETEMNLCRKKGTVSYGFRGCVLKEVLDIIDKHLSEVEDQQCQK